MARKVCQSIEHTSWTSMESMRALQHLQVTGSSRRTSLYSDSLSCIQSMWNQRMLLTYRAPIEIQRESLQMSPVFQVAFANKRNSLAAVDESGYVFLLHSNELSKSVNPMESSSIVQSWQAHNNAIFDIIWSCDDTKVVTASGDLSIVGWDIETQKQAFTLQGHTMSVKTVRQQSNLQPHIYVSGARDGDLMLWDVRISCEQKKPVAHVKQIHGFENDEYIVKRKCPSTLSVNRQRKMYKKNSTNRSVTCVEFTRRNDWELATAGAANGVVKFWDTRKLLQSNRLPCSGKKRKRCAGQSNTNDTDCVQSLVCRTRDGQAVDHGVSSMAFNADASRMLVNLRNHEIQIFDITQNIDKKKHIQEPSLVKRATGHQVPSFYGKATFSPPEVGDFIAAASADGLIVIWDYRNHSESPAAVLKNDSTEVNGIDWSLKEGKSVLASCSDTGTVRCWTPTLPYSTNTQSKLVYQRNESLREWANQKEFNRLHQEGEAYAVSVLPIRQKTVEAKTPSLKSHTHTTSEVPSISPNMKSKMKPSTLFDHWKPTRK